MSMPLYLLGQSVNYNGQESVGGVELEEVHRVVQRVGGPVGVDGEEELAREAGHVLVEGILHEDRQATVEPVAVNEESSLKVHELKKTWGSSDIECTGRRFRIKRRKYNYSLCCLTVWDISFYVRVRS